MRKNSQDAVNEFRPYFDHAPVYGYGPSLEDFTRQTPLTVGSPEQVIDRTLSFRETFGDYQRQLFLMDHAGLPLKTVLEQLDILGEEVVPGAAQGIRRVAPGSRSGRPDPPEPAGRRPRAEHRTRTGRSYLMTTLAVISAGLSQPSSTRLLADRLAEAVVATSDQPVQIINIELGSWPTTSPTTC